MMYFADVQGQHIVVFIEMGSHTPRAQPDYYQRGDQGKQPQPH